MVHTRRIRHSKVEESNNGKIHRKKQNITKAANLFVCAGGVCAMFHVRIEKCDKNRKQKTEKKKIMRNTDRNRKNQHGHTMAMLPFAAVASAFIIYKDCRLDQKYFMCIIKDGGQEKNRQKRLYNCM